MKTSTKMPKGVNCPICCDIWKKGQNSIRCKNCKKSVHGPGKFKTCSVLSVDDYNILMGANSSDPNWLCTICTSRETALNFIDNNELHLLNCATSIDSVNISVCSNESTEAFIRECNELSLKQFDPDSDDDQDDLFDNINSKYYNIHQFNTDLKYDKDSSLAICHTNIASISKHIDDLRLSLSMLKTNFHIIGITEHKIRDGMDPIVNLDIEGFKPFIYDTTKTSHGGTGFFISESINHKLRDDLKFNSAGDFESTFVEIILPDKKI